MGTLSLRLASLVLLVNTAAAKIYLTGSGGFYPTNKTCNGTAYGPTGATGATGTTGPTGVTGTSPISTKTSSRCVFKTSLLTYEAVTVFSTVGYTQTDLGNGPYISGDTLTPVNGTATAFVTATETSTIPETRTLTYVYPGTFVTVGSTATVTVPTPSGFLPVQSTLPNATYGYKNPCNISTTVITSTLTLSSEIVPTSTITGPILQTNTTAFPLSQFTDFSVVIATVTSTTAVYEDTIATTSYGEPQTVTPDAVSVYPACATNNFADAVVSDPTNPEYINSYLAPGGQNAIRFDLGPETPRDCCIYALTYGADLWTFGYGFGCGFAYNVNGGCAPESKNATAISTDQLGAQTIVVGNALCARFTALEVDTS